tara:strand:- start:604 stop:879 length:276 start_codon:yes stop_codon:yes gene_type:complete
MRIACRDLNQLKAADCTAVIACIQIAIVAGFVTGLSKPQIGPMHTVTADSNPTIVKTAICINFVAIVAPLGFSVSFSANDAVTTPSSLTVS